MKFKKNSLAHNVEKKSQRLIKAKDNKMTSFWLGFSFFGLVGWSVVIPTLLGVGIGVWIDKNYPSTHSWTLMLLIGGIFLGSIFAWTLVEKERLNIHKKGKDE